MFRILVSVLNTAADFVFSQVINKFVVLFFLYCFIQAFLFALPVIVSFVVSHN
jgi:hypothetical protein